MRPPNRHHRSAYPPSRSTPTAHARTTIHVELINQDGDMTMPKLAGALVDTTGVQAHPDAIGRFLHKLGYTYKKRHWSLPSGAGHG